MNQPVRRGTMLVFASGLALLWAPVLSAADKVISGEFYAERPTLVSLGFEWSIGGDDNRNATVAVSYRKKGDRAWKEGLPLLRIGNERINGSEYVRGKHLRLGTRRGI